MRIVSVQSLTEHRRTEQYSGWPRHRENREFGSYFFQTGKTQGILLWHREKFWDTGKIFFCDTGKNLDTGKIFDCDYLNKKCVYFFKFQNFLASLRSALVFTSKYYYWLQQSWAKIMFLQVSVCPQGEVLPQCMLGYHPPDQAPPRPGTPLDQTPQTRHPPWDQPPLGSRCQHTVNERPVRILLECILVYFCFHMLYLLFYLCIYSLADYINVWYLFLEKDTYLTYFSIICSANYEDVFFIV